jgi:hypothetical protein
MKGINLFDVVVFIAGLRFDLGSFCCSADRIFEPDGVDKNAFTLDGKEGSGFGVKFVISTLRTFQKLIQKIEHFMDCGFDTYQTWRPISAVVFRT